MTIKQLTIAALTLVATSMSAQQTYKIPVLENDEPMATGQFTPDWASLRTYEVPEWFRDAKFGIWAHWGPQCVEGSGDWMARGLYLEGGGQYNYHRSHYGHPSEFGFKDVLPLFKAENWTPEELVKFYKEVSSPSAITTTTSTSGIRSIRSGTRRTSALTRTSSTAGQKPPRKPVSPSASPSTPTTLGLGMNLLAVST